MASAQHPPKVLLIGHTGAGVTTAILTLSDEPPSTVEMIGPNGSTLAFDHGRLYVDGDDSLHLYGVREDVPMPVVADLLGQDSIGLALLLSASRPDPLADLRSALDLLRPYVQDNNLAIGITHTDRNKPPQLSEYHRQFYGTGIKPPMFEVDPRNRDDLSVLIQALLYSIDPGVSE